MKTNQQILALVAAATLAMSGAASAGIVNGDFATGDLTGWTATPNVNVISAGSGYAADLFAGSGTGVPSTLSQSVTLNAGDTLTGWAQWLGHDYLPYNDNGFVTIGSTTLFSADIGTYGDYGASSLTSFSFVAPTAGTYLLAAGVANQGDNGLPSELKVGGFAVSSVPEPASVGLFSLALLGLGALRRRAS